MPTPDPSIERWLSSPFIVGALGAVVALRGTPGQTWPERLFNVVCGALVAGYCGPLAAAFLGIQSPAVKDGAAFLMGLFGMNLAAALVLIIKDTKLADVVPWLRKKGD